jgi:hypothetical protein
MVKSAGKTTKNAKKQPVSAKKPAQARPEPVQEIDETSSENKHDICSISALARRFKLDRATVRTRIEKAGIKAIEEKVKEKLYVLDERLESVLSEDEMEAAKLRKTEAEANLKEIEVRKKLGEYASVSEFTEIIQRMMSRFYSKTVVDMPRKLATKLHNANSSAEVAELLKNELIKEWKNLRDEYSDYINDSRSNRKGNS